MVAFTSLNSSTTAVLTRVWPTTELSEIDLPHMDLPQIDLPQIELPQINLPRIDLPQIDLPQISVADSLNSLGIFASQLQIAITAALTHPFWAIGILIVSIGLLQLIADLVKRILKAGIKLVLTFPLTVSQWLWKQATTPLEANLDNKDKIAQLIDRLETLRTEQDQVVAELKTLLNTSAVIEPKQPQQPVDSALSALLSSVELPET